MTCREKLKIEYPEYVKSIYIGGCKSCPDRYGYIRYCERCRNGVPSEEKCARCWDREISGDFGWMIKKVIFNNPATIVLWSDSTKTVVKCQEGDVYDPEKGLAMAISKKALGNKGNFNEVFKKWLPDEESIYLTPVAWGHSYNPFAELNEAIRNFNARMENIQNRPLEKDEQCNNTFKQFMSNELKEETDNVESEKM